VPLSRVTDRFLVVVTVISCTRERRAAEKSCIIRPFPCARLAPAQPEVEEEKEWKYALSLYPLSDISIIARNFLKA
jgi:hypothetical protein